MKRGSKILLALLLLLVLLLSWLLASKSGLQWTFQRAATYLPAGIDIKKIDGTLYGPLEIGAITYQHDGSDPT